MAKEKELSKFEILEQKQAELNKRFGDGSVIRMDTIKKFDAIPTGILSVDEALGGGFARGRMSEVAGWESAGKCLSKDTYVLTPQGYKTVEAIFKENGVEPYCVTKTIPKEVLLINRYGKEEKTVAFTCNGRKTIRKVTLKNGIELDCTGNHPLLIMDTSGLPVWKKVDHLKEGDYVILYGRSDIEPLEEIDEEAYSLGALVKDVYIPPLIFTASQKIKLSFLKGYLDCEAHVTPNQCLEVVSANHRIASEVQLLLQEFNIVSTKSLSLPDNDYWKVHISGNNFQRLSTALYRTVVKEDTIDPCYSTPYAGSYNKNYAYIEVKSIEKGEKIPTFDFAMSETHSFIANGIVNHNTTVVLHAIAECQKNGGVCAYVDAEHAYDASYAENIGVNTKDLWLSQPSSAEEAYEIAESLCEVADLVAIDSTNALVPQAEIDGDAGDAFMGLPARLSGQACKKIVPKIAKSNCAFVWISQIRKSIGFSAGNVIGVGNAVKFYSSQRLELARTKTNKTTGGDALSNEIQIKVIKNKLAPPYKIANVQIEFGTGFSIESDLISIAERYDIVQKGGAWYSYNGEKIGQGLEKVKARLCSDYDLYEEIKKKVATQMQETKELLATARKHKRVRVPKKEIKDAGKTD